MQLPVIFSQRDKQWAGDFLGNSRVYFGDYGCLLTSYAIVLRFFGVNITPKQLNEKVKAANGTTSSGALYWGVMTKLFPNFTQKVIDAQDRALTDAELKEITDAIKSGIPVILQVDFVPATAKADMHFTVGFDYVDGKITIADPWTGQAYSLRSKYGQSDWTLKRAIYRFVIFKPVQVSKPAETPTAAKNDGNADALKVCVAKVDDLTKQIKELKSDLEKETKKRKQTEAERDAAEKTGGKYKQAIADISDRIGKI